MPIYEYQCQSCGKRMEQLQNLSDPPLTVCPSCSGELKKLISSPAFQFKGSGWYVTDYAGKKGAGSGDSSSSKSEKSAGSSDGKPEGKAEAKSDGGGGEKAESKPKESAAPAAKPSAD